MLLIRLSSEMMIGRKVMNKSATVTHFPEVEMFNIRLAHVMKHIRSTKPRGRLSQFVHSMRFAASLVRNGASSAGVGGLLKKRWTPKTTRPRTYMPRKANVLGRASPFSRMSSPEIRRYFARFLSSAGASALTSSEGASVASSTGSSTVASSLTVRPHASLARSQSNNFPHQGSKNQWSTPHACSAFPRAQP